MTKKSMARKTAESPTFVFTIGVCNQKHKSPNESFIYNISDDHLQIINDQIFKAWLYRKTLTEIECQRRETYRAIRSQFSPDIKRLEREYEQAQANYDEARKSLYMKPSNNPARKGYSISKTERNESDIENVKVIAKIQKEIWERLKSKRKEVEELFLSEPREEFNKRKEIVILQHLEQTRPELNEEARRLLAGCPKEMTEDEYAAAKKSLCKKRGGNDPALEQKIQNIRDKMFENKRWSAWRKIEESDCLAKEQWKIARKESGCFSGVGIAIDSAMVAAIRDTKYNPRTPVFTGEGKVGIQLAANKGLKVKDALSCIDPNLKLEIYNKQPHLRKNKFGLRKAGIARIKLAGNKKNAVWIDIPIIVSRPLPEDGIIKWAYLVCRKVGTRKIYELQLTIESKDFFKVRNPQNEMIAINFGWRTTQEGDICVATTWDGTKSEKIFLPQKMVTRNNYARSLLGFADDHFNDTIKVLSDWLKSNNIDDKLYQDLKLENINKWRSHSKLVKVAFTFKDNYLSNVNVKELWNNWQHYRKGINKDFFLEHNKDKKEDNENPSVLFSWFDEQGIVDPHQQIALYLDWWRRKDKHLIDCARNIIRKLALQRREIYRRKAVNWSREYVNVCFEKWDKSITAKNPTIENDNESPQEEKARSIRQFCGISVFTDVLKQKFTKQVKEKKPKDITKVHHNCGGQAISETAKSINVLCGKCHKLYDQDVNAAMNLWESERPGDEKKPATARKRNKSSKAA